jgi:hypothetical protein
MQLLERLRVFTWMIYGHSVHQFQSSTLKLTLASLLFPFSISAQPSDFKLLKSIPVNATLISPDRLGNLYVVTEKQELLRYNPAGALVYRYNNIALGRISYLGTTNPLKILVYYPDYSTIVTLDNTLSQTSRINLFELGSNKVSAACVSLDNNYWIYDEVIFKLRKFDEKFNILAQSEDLNVLLGISVHANFLLEKDNYLYLNDPETGILVFDLFGTYYKTIPLKGLDGFQKIQDQLVFFKEGKLFTYHLLTFVTQEIALPVTDALSASLEKDRLCILRKGLVDVYSHTK